MSSYFPILNTLFFIFKIEQSNKLLALNNQFVVANYASP